MRQGHGWLGLLLVMSGCRHPAAAWKGVVEWPDERSARPVESPIPAGAVQAAMGAVREFVRTNPRRLFSGCEHPEDGVNVSLFTGPTPGLYYVLVDPDFERCVGPRRRILDGWFFYAVTPQGDVVAESPGPPDEGAPVEPPRAPPPPAPEPPAPEPSGDVERSSGAASG
ncbi:hypothetical protein D7X55_31345 [Corallococcus sp. AB049A]|uniref:Lipoprotein n=1 Tax=Corallococcus interemptor TaxID=2316720 RepID=A0A3A8QR52_9BACT|nr:MULTISPECIES: hypothetical protein [Corallococcus]RKH68845.1 hypothetical protein D7X96_16645 [Corallococcus interemptor]RKI53344.1 hypothetical protein D7X55_31345 [Corallococcus sp. AB049A]